MERRFSIKYLRIQSFRMKSESEQAREPNMCKWKKIYSTI